MLLIVSDNPTLVESLYLPSLDAPFLAATRLLRHPVLVLLHRDTDTSLSDLAAARLADHFIWSHGTFSYQISSRVPGIHVACGQVIEKNLATFDIILLDNCTMTSDGLDLVRQYFTEHGARGRGIKVL